MPSAGFEPATVAIERPQNYALDLTATGIGQFLLYWSFFLLLGTNSHKI